MGLTSGGDLGFPGEVSYGAAKAARTTHTMSAAVELGDLGITANMVHPPVTDTGWITDAVRQFVADSSTHFQAATAEGVAEVVAFLASDAAALVTGNVIALRRSPRGCAAPASTGAWTGHAFPRAVLDRRHGDRCRGHLGDRSRPIEENR